MALVVTPEEKVVDNQTQQAQGTSTLTRWAIDPAHSEVGFAAKHMMISTVRGRFSNISGFIDFDESDPSAALVDVEVDVASVDTRQEGRDQHLRSADFFDAENHPQMKFVSRKVEHAKGNEYKVTGDLTIRGTTREVTLDGTFEGAHPDPWGGTRAGFTASGKINRHDFGLNWNATIEAGGVVVGPEIKIQLEIEAVKQAN
jgi:polyisoprenoid-binding protein YceI